MQLSSALYPPLLASALLLTSCSMLKNSPESINELAAQQQYDKAITEYQKLSEEDKKTVDIKALEQKRSTYEKTNIAYIQKLQQKQQFQQAQEQLNKAQQNIPSSDALKKLQDKQTTIEQKHQQKYQLAYDKILADFYLKEAPLLSELVKVQNSQEHQQLQKSREQDSKKVADNLGQNGMQAYAEKDTKTATTLLSLANKLQPNKQWQDALASMAKSKKKKRVVARKKAAKKTSNKLQKLQATYNKQFAQSDWLQAQLTLKQIDALKLSKKEQKWLNSEQDRLNKITLSIANEKKSAW